MESIDTEKRPVILTKHGRGKYILLSIEDYNQLATMSELYKTIDEGIADIEAGHVSDFREFTNQLRKDIKNIAMNGSTIQCAVHGIEEILKAEGLIDA